MQSAPVDDEGKDQAAFASQIGSLSFDCRNEVALSSQLTKELVAGAAIGTAAAE